MTNNRGLIALLFLTTFAAQTIFVAWGQDKPERKPTPSKSATADLLPPKASGPFSLNTTLDYVGDLTGFADVYRKHPTERNKRNLEVRRKKIFDLYNDRGVAFYGTPEEFDKLKAAGIDEEFFSLIKNLVPPPVPPTKKDPPPPPTGSIEAFCDPKECEVALGNSPPVKTQEGKALFEKLQPGQVTIKFTQDHYIDKTQSVKVVAGITLTVKVELEKSPKELLESVWSALGAGERGANLQEISGTGSVSLFDLAGKETDWRIAAKFTDKSLSTFDFKSLTDKPAFKIQCDNPCRYIKTATGLGGRGKPLIEPEEASWLLTKFRPNHLGSMIRQLTAEDVRVTSSILQPSSGNRVFQLEGPARTFELELGPSQLPIRVFVKETHGSDVYEVIYSDYIKISESSQYPLHTEFRMKTNQRGVKIEFAGKVAKAN